MVCLVVSLLEGFGVHTASALRREALEAEVLALTSEMAEQEAELEHAIEVCPPPAITMRSGMQSSKLLHGRILAQLEFFFTHMHAYPKVIRAPRFMVSFRLFFRMCSYALCSRSAWAL